MQTNWRKLVILTFWGPCFVIIRTIETNKMHCFSTLFWFTTLHVSDRLTAHHQESWYYLCWLSASTKVKVKCTLVQALRLCIGRTAHTRNRGIALLFHDHGTRRGWGVSVMPRPLFTPGKDPVPMVQEAGWAPGPVWTGAENLAPPPGFDPRTVQPVASRYTVYATRPTSASRQST
jgi:hypothetical protein